MRWLVLVAGLLSLGVGASALPAPSDAPLAPTGPPAIVTRDTPPTIRPVPTVPLLPSLVPPQPPLRFPLGEPTASPTATRAAEPSPLPTVARTPPPTPEPASSPPPTDEDR
jgi:hypothetical protein